MYYLKFYRMMKSQLHNRITFCLRFQFRLYCLVKIKLQCWIKFKILLEICCVIALSLDFNVENKKLHCLKKTAPTYPT